VNSSVTLITYKLSSMLNRCTYTLSTTSICLYISPINNISIIQLSSLSQCPVAQVNYIIQSYLSTTSRTSVDNSNCAKTLEASGMFSPSNHRNNYPRLSCISCTGRVQLVGPPILHRRSCHIAPFDDTLSSGPPTYPTRHVAVAEHLEHWTGNSQNFWVLYNGIPGTVNFYYRLCDLPTFV